MKRGIAFVAAVMTAFMIASCGKPDFMPETRNFVYEFQRIKSLENSLICVIPNLDDFNVVTSMASQIVLCTIESLDEVKYVDKQELFDFIYSVEINDIIIDKSGSLSKADIIKVHTDNGILKAADAIQYMVDTHSYWYSKRIKEFMSSEVGDNDYIISHNFCAVPIEPGHSYIMFLSDKKLAENGYYGDSSCSFLCEYSGKSALSRFGDSAVIEPLADVLARIKDALANPPSTMWG